MITGASSCTKASPFRYTNQRPGGVVIPPGKPRKMRMSQSGRWDVWIINDQYINIKCAKAFQAFCFVFANLFSMFDYNSARCNSFDQCVCGMVLVDRFDLHHLMLYSAKYCQIFFYFDSSYKKPYGSPHKTAASRSTKLFFEIARDHQDFPCRMDSSRFCVAKSACFWGMVWPVLEAQNFCLRDGCLFCFFRFVLSLV